MIFCIQSLVYDVYDKYDERKLPFESPEALCNFGRCSRKRSLHSQRATQGCPCTVSDVLILL